MIPYLVKRERRIRSLALLVILVAIFTVIFAVENMLTSFVLAFVINFLLAPIANLLERHGFSRNISVIIPFCALLLLGVLVASLLLPPLTDQVNRFVREIPSYREQLIALVVNLEDRVKNYLNLSEVSFSAGLVDWIVGQTRQFSTILPSWFSWLSRSLTVLVLAPLIAFFMLLDGRRITRSIINITPNHLFELVLNLQHQIGQQMGGFVRARLLEGLIVCLVVWVGLETIGFPYAFIFAFVAGLMNLVPYIGPVIGVLPALIMVLVSPPDLSASWAINMLAVGIVFGIAQLIDILFIIPLVVAKIVNLHPVTVILSFIIGAQLMGVLGMIISIPLASAIKLTLFTFYQHMVYFRS